MKRALISTAVVLLSLVFAGTAAAQPSTPPFDTGAIGFELCTQADCGAAIFYGAIQGDVDNADSAGAFAVAITHSDLPAPGEGGFAEITGGALIMQFGTDTYEGTVIGGWLTNNDDGTYGVWALIQVGDAYVVFEGVLDHNFFPPFIYGALYTALAEPILAGGRP